MWRCSSGEKIVMSFYRKFACNTMVILSKSRPSFVEDLNKIVIMFFFCSPYRFILRSFSWCDLFFSILFVLLIVILHVKINKNMNVKFTKRQLYKKVNSSCPVPNGVVNQPPFLKFLIIYRIEMRLKCSLKDVKLSSRHGIRCLRKCEDNASIWKSS